MRCFYHGDVEAVAVCKSCGHGVCHDCCADVGTSAACRNRCEPDVQVLNDIIQRGRTVYQKLSAVYFWISMIFFAFGLLGIGGALLTLRTAEPDYSGIAFGAVCTLLGVVLFVFSRRFRAK